MFWRPRRQLVTIYPHDDTRPDFCEHPRAICTARDFGEPSSAARNVSPTWAGLCSSSLGLATSDLWSSPHIHRWRCTFTIVTALDGVAPCLGDFGRLRLRCLCH